MVNAKSSGRMALLPALIGAVVCLFLIRSGFGVFFFLLPLGFVGFGWGPKTLWPALAFAVLGNCLVTVSLGAAISAPAADMAWDILYFTVMTAAFAWIILPPDERSAGIPGAYRLAVGAVICTLVFVGLFFRAFGDPAFLEAVRAQIEVITGLYFAGNSPEAQAALMESLDVEGIIQFLKDFIIRGGALFSSVAIFFVNRQLSVWLIRLFGGPRRKKAFEGFFVVPRLIWLFSVSLALCFASSVFEWTGPGIVLWNLVTLCALMYLAQGLGIIRFFTARQDFPAFLRFVLPVVFIILLFWAGLNALMLGALIILGIVETWIPFRQRAVNAAQNRNGSNGEPPSTPGV